MTEFFIEFINTFITYSASTCVKLYPMWEMRDLKNRTIAVLVCCNILFLFFSLVIFKQFVDIDIHILQWFKLLSSLPQMIIPFFIFRKKFFQNLFLYLTMLMYAPVSTGIGNYAAMNWFASSAYPILAGTMIQLAVIAVTIPPLLYILRRLCKNPYMEKSVIWRYIWIFPVLFFGLFMMGGTYLTVNFPRSAGFFIIRGVLFIALLLICYLLDIALRQSSENIMLRENARLHENQLNLQREQYEKFMENEKALNRIRHDIRHHFTVLEKLADDKEFGKIKDYSKDMANNLNPAREIYCENKTVNAIAAHYLGLAKAEGIAIDAHLDIPCKTGKVPETDLCVIMGNILENAFEACKRQAAEKGARHIRVRSRYRPDSGTLSIVAENSFDGLSYEQNGMFMSRKENKLNREGIGLASIQTVCRKHGGYAKFETDGNIWRSSAIIKIEE